MKYSGFLLGSIAFLSVSAASFSTTPVEAYSQYYPYRNISDHLLTEVNYGESLVMLEDGSQWKVSGNDYFNLMTWRPYDSTYITPNYYYSDFKYYITNLRNGSYVLANLVNAPIRGAPYTHTITGMDTQSYGKKAIYLSNGTFWSVSESDAHLLHNWMMDDLIIIGRNSEWFTSNHNILINVATNNFVRVRKM